MIRRRVVLLLCLATVWPVTGRAEIERVTVDHDYVRDLAEALAGRAYSRRRMNELPEFFRRMRYDDYRRIRFIPENALWATEGLPFRVQFFHPGWLHQTPVRMNEFSPTHAQRLPFVRAFFDYQDLAAPARIPPSLDYAGWRLLSPFQQQDRWDEVISYLGASYFRALGRGQRYGMSARGLALNAGGPETEEFPDFVEFWLGKPAADARSLTVHALLDSPSVAGAYTFVVTPGDETVVETRATLFFRRPVANVGLAPLTSMFWFGENSELRFGDFRPEVHDSDGLLVATDTTARLWRPLVNPAAVRHTDFAAAALHGFGLLQRDRAFRSYEDTEARYDLRPGVWVEPVGAWPEGRVRLVELPTATEFADNIVASWAVTTPPAPGVPLEFSYRLRWTGAPAFGGPVGHVVATRQTVQLDRPGRTRFVIDFESEELAALPVDAPVTGEIVASADTRVSDVRAFRNEVEGNWRLSVVLEAPPGANPQELRARLVVAGSPITETWNTTWLP